MRSTIACLIIVITATLFLHQTCQICRSDGLVIKKRDYHGSLEEASQEAVIIFRPSDQTGQAVQDLILSIEVRGNASEFAWVIPFPNAPETFAEDDGLFRELFDYVEIQRQRMNRKLPGQGIDASALNDARSAVEVVSRHIVGDYEVTVVRENSQGGLNPWLIDNEFQPLKDAEDILDFYRKKNYVYACIRYTAEALASTGSLNSHPLRFRFKTGGRDGMYFPMKLTGLQENPFDVTLYVFSPSWINDKLNLFGFTHRGFHLTYRDWDTPQCIPNAGKLYSSPTKDVFLRSASEKLPVTTELFRTLYPGQRFYLTRLQSYQMNPRTVRYWPDDLWLFPFYTNKQFIPWDVRSGGVASAAWPNPEKILFETRTQEPGSAVIRAINLLAILASFTLALICIPLLLRRMLVGSGTTAGNTKDGAVQPHPVEKRNSKED